MPSQKSYRLIMLFLTVALVAPSVVALCVGRYSVNPTEAFGAVCGIADRQCGCLPGFPELFIPVLREAERGDAQ